MVAQNLRLLRAPARRALFGQILRFAVVGTFGFIIDTAIVYATRNNLGLYGAGVMAFLVAGSVNWALNRTWTFRDRRPERPRTQLARYLAVNLTGFVLNRGAYAALVTYWPPAAAEPVLATAAGAVAGMGVNFVLSRRLVFR